MTGPGGVAHLEKNLWAVRKKYAIDFCVVNGENASFISGVGREAADVLLRSGADVISGGNHTMQNFSARELLDYEERVLRPINYGKSAPGHGFCIVDTGACRVLVINALGNIHMEPVLDLPFSHVDWVLRANADKYDVAILDIHAEATGEKLAIAHNYDGKINVIFGTHTHVPTSDLSILPKGSGYVTDLGMCGESGGILGMEIESVIHKIKNRLPGKFRAAEGKVVADAVIFELDSLSGKVTDVKRIRF